MHDNEEKCLAEEEHENAGFFLRRVDEADLVQNAEEGKKTFDERSNFLTTTLLSYRSI
jgi:hypothetical protein